MYDTSRDNVEFSLLLLLLLSSKTRDWRPRASLSPWQHLKRILAPPAVDANLYTRIERAPSQQHLSVPVSLCQKRCVLIKTPSQCSHTFSVFPKNWATHASAGQTERICIKILTR